MKMILKYGGDSNTTHKIHFNVTITIDGMELKYEIKVLFTFAQVTMTKTKRNICRKLLRD